MPLLLDLHNLILLKVSGKSIENIDRGVELSCSEQCNCLVMFHLQSHRYFCIGQSCSIRAALKICLGFAGEVVIILITTLFHLNLRPFFWKILNFPNVSELWIDLSQNGKVKSELIQHAPLVANLGCYINIEFSLNENTKLHLASINCSNSPGTVKLHKVKNWMQKIAFKYFK